MQVLDGVPGFYYRPGMRKQQEAATLNMSGVKVTPSTKAAMVKLWRKEAAPQESFGAWARRKLLTPQPNGGQP